MRQNDALYPWLSVAECKPSREAREPYPIVHYSSHRSLAKKLGSLQYEGLVAPWTGMYNITYSILVTLCRETLWPIWEIVEHCDDQINRIMFMSTSF